MQDRQDFTHTVTLNKLDAEKRILYGYAIVSKEADGSSYIDLQGDHISEQAMYDAAIDFMKTARIAQDSHTGTEIGNVLFAIPVTEDIAKAMDIVTKKRGLFIGMEVSQEVADLYISGEYEGFSIGGTANSVPFSG